MLRKKTASIVTLALLLGLSGLFACGIALIAEKDTETLFYKSSTYYPLILTALMLFFILLALYRDLFGADKNESGTLDFTHYRRYFLVLLTAGFIAFVWGTFELFYPAAAVGTTVLLYALSPKPSGWKKLAFSAGVGIGFVVLVYLIFGLALSVRL